MSIASSISTVLPHLTQAQAELTRLIDVVNEHGVREQVSIPAERALTVYVDKREIVTLMTLGAHPELLVLGYLRNQRLVGDVSEVESITVDWDAGEDGAGVAAVKTRHGIADIAGVGSYGRPGPLASVSKLKPGHRPGG